MTDEQSVSIRDRVLDSISQRGITPKPRWHFLLREGVVWLVALGAFVVGSVASALSIYIANASRFMEHAIELTNLDTLFGVIPFVWLALFGVAVFYAVHAVRGTSRGYRFHAGWLVLLAVVLSNGMGYVLHAQGLGAVLDHYLLAEMPLYPPMSGFRPGHWMRPESGVIAGVVIHTDGTVLTVHPLEGSDLAVVRSTSTIVACPGTGREIIEGMQVRIVGTSTGEHTYEAYAICEFRGRGGRGARRMQIEMMNPRE